MLIKSFILFMPFVVFYAGVLFVILIKFGYTWTDVVSLAILLFLVVVNIRFAMTGELTRVTASREQVESAVRKGMLLRRNGKLFGKDVPKSALIFKL